jgi:hypothetical protein
MKVMAGCVVMNGSTCCAFPDPESWDERNHQEKDNCRRLSDEVPLKSQYGWANVKNVKNTQDGGACEKKFMFTGSSGEYGLEGLGKEVVCYNVDDELNRIGSKFRCRLFATIVFSELEAAGLHNKFLFSEKSTIVEIINEQGDVVQIACFEGLEGRRRTAAVVDQIIGTNSDDGSDVHMVLSLDDPSLPNRIELCGSSVNSARFVKMFMGELWKCSIYEGMRYSENEDAISYFSNERFADTTVACAVKWVRNSRLQSNNGSIGFEPLNEIKTMRYLNSLPSSERRGIIQLVDVIQSDILTGIVMPFYKDGDLFEYLLGYSGLWTEEQALNTFHKICVGVSSLHRAGVCHRDLSAENILVVLNSAKEISETVVIDFGQSIIESGTDAAPAIRTNQKTYKKLYRPPELVVEPLVAAKTVDYYKADIWALGVILYFLLTRNMPFDENSWNGQQSWFGVCKSKDLGEKLVQVKEFNVATKRYQHVSRPLYEVVSDESLELLTKLLTYDPNERLSNVDELLASSLFRVSSPALLVTESLLSLSS